MKRLLLALVVLAMFSISTVPAMAGHGSRSYTSYSRSHHSQVRYYRPYNNNCYTPSYRSYSGHGRSYSYGHNNGFSFHFGF